MEEITKTLEQYQLEDIWNLGIHKGFPVVIWRLPFESKIHLMVDTRPFLKQQKIDLEAAPPGFLINPYSSAHPCHPYFLKADLHFTLDGGTRQLRISPEVSSSTIDNFKQAFEREPNEKWRKPHANAKGDGFKEQVQKAINVVENQSLHKVVLSRFEEVTLPAGFQAFQFLQNLSERYENTLTYLFHLPEKGTWAGATPEELIHCHQGKTFKTVALAGTQALQSPDKLSLVAWTQKEIEEQALVSRYIINCFKKIRLREFDEYGPKTIKAGHLAHLKTTFTVDMEATNMPKLGSMMMDLLHPTSAICGMPLEEARQFIEEHENYDREFYAGFLGPVNLEESTHLFVNLRCMQLFDKVARLYAGAGITADSDPEKEFMETELKLKTLKKVIFDR